MIVALTAAVPASATTTVLPGQKLTATFDLSAAPTNYAYLTAQIAYEGGAGKYKTSIIDGSNNVIYGFSEDATGLAYNQHFGLPNQITTSTLSVVLDGFETPAHISGISVSFYNNLPGSDYPDFANQLGRSATSEGLYGASAFSVTASAVPEAATWAMLLVGFGGIGAASRYRRRSTLTTLA